MKLQLDTVNKTIKIESDIVLSELVENLEKLLPEGLWKEFTIQTHTTINNWNNPLIIEKSYPRPYWGQPWLMTTNENKFLCKSGIYDVKC